MALPRLYRRLSALALAFVPAAPATAADVHALLVGVSDYENFADDQDLRGPGNDVRELARLIVERGVAPQRIGVLADKPGVLPAGLAASRPTRAAILAAFDRLVDTVGPGDTVLFYFSGHGSRQPDRDGDENGGPDEIFLPIDAGRWNGAAGAVDNAIVDDELHERARAITAKGAALVAIIDACHSATGFRALSPSASRSREVMPELLGVPEAEIATPVAGNTSAGIEGDYVFLYSAQADQRAFEYPARPGAPDDEWFGDFTFNLVASLRETPRLTWRQLAQVVTDRMRDDRALGVQRPEIEGTLVDDAAFLSEGGAARRHRIENGRLAAGLLDGLSEGATLALFGSAAGGEPLGLGTATKVTATDAVVTGLDGTVSGAAAYAEIRDAGTAAPVVFSRPIRRDPGDGHDYAAVLDALAALEGDEDLAFSADGYDVALVLTDGTVAIGDRSGAIDTAGPGASFRFAFDGRDLSETLAEGLSKIARVQTLYRATRPPKDAISFALPGAGLSTRVAMRKAAEVSGACPKVAGLDDAVPVTGTPMLQPCDIVVLTLENASTNAQDVTVLHVGADFAVTPLWPKPGQSNRIAFRESVRLPLRVSADSIGGEERLIVLSVAAPPDRKERTVLTGLAQDGIARDIAPGSAEAWIRARLDPGSASRTTLSLAPPPLKTIQHAFIVARKPGAPQSP